MYIDRSFPEAQGAESRHYPPDLTSLFRREREIAMIVYDCGLATANEVGTRLSEPLSNAAVRSMLNRLVHKGVLTRQLLRRERAFIYGPALTVSSSRQAALRQFADDFYDGSLSAFANAVADLIARRRATSANDMAALGAAVH